MIAASASSPCLSGVLLPCQYSSELANLTTFTKHEVEIAFCTIEKRNDTMFNVIVGNIDF